MHRPTIEQRWVSLRVNPAYILLPLIGLLLTVVLFLLLGWIIRGPEGEGLGPQRTIDAIEVVQADPPSEEPPDPIKALENAPPPPPAAPPALGRPDLPALNVPSLALDPTPIGDISVPVALGASGLSLGKAGAFGGFGSGTGGSGSGAGGGAYGGGGWKGKPLVPLSTARPQMPEWACKQKLDGWVEAVFVVMPNGRVQDIRIVDANPRGVFEAAAVESISNWIYEPTGKAAEVKQRVPMNHEDCAYNWR
ncbi:MAG: TonB family protein [Panacagrimonas sp.]